MITRRSFLRTSAITLLGLTDSFLFGCRNRSNSGSTQLSSALDDIGPLLPPDNNGVMLPEGFSSRIIARSGIQPYIGSPYLWHNSPDGGATFSAEDNAWIYVSNSEVGNNLGGVGAIRFDESANIIDAYSILENSNQNCAGGPTSWNTWLSCEEHDSGIIWECDPYGILLPVQKPALGVFAHEAAALDITTNIIYLTEDKPDGCFYRFIPDSFTTDGSPDLNSGSLEVAIVDLQNLSVSWLPVPDPSALSQPTRYQVGSSAQFNGGEGIVFYNGVVSFATKGDNKILSYNTKSNLITVIYDVNTHPTPLLTGVDNITLSKEGALVVGEDGGDLQVVAITKSNKLVPLAQLVGHKSSEVTGPAFSPNGMRLYFSSQRGTSGISSDGVTFEITGPFHR